MNFKYSNKFIKQEIKSNKQDDNKNGNYQQKKRPNLFICRFV